MVEEFPYYGLSWFFYLLVAASFLLLCAWKTRHWSMAVRIPLLSFIAAMALTPGTTISGESWWSPAAIIMIFELDQKGLIGIWRSAISIIMVWLLLMAGSFTVRWRLGKKQPTRQLKQQSETVDESEVDEFSQPELKDPEINQP